MHQNLLLGENIKRWRSFKGFKQQHLAASLGISRVTLSKYENGRSEISYMQLQMIAATLEVPLEQLLPGN